MGERIAVAICMTLLFQWVSEDGIQLQIATVVGGMLFLVLIEEVKLVTQKNPLSYFSTN